MVRLWDAATGSGRGVFKGHSGAVNAVAFPPDGQLVASGSKDGTVRLWDAAMGSARGTLKGYWSWARAVAFSPDGQLVVEGSEGSEDGMFTFRDTTLLSRFGGPRGLQGSSLTGRPAREFNGGGLRG
jgi:WD40 repeat protein